MTLNMGERNVVEGIPGILGRMKPFGELRRSKLA